jgi:hypothetical protein
MTDLSDSFRFNERWSQIVSHGALALMLAYAASVIAQPVRVLMPQWDVALIPYLAFVVALESILAYRMTRRYGLFSLEWLRYRLPEVVVILAALRIYVGLQSGLAVFWQEITGWWGSPWYGVFTPEYLAVVVILGTIWLLASLLAGDLFDLEGDEYLLKWGQVEEIPSDRPTAHRLLASRLIILGVMLMMIVGALKQDRVALPWFQPVQVVDVFPLLAYFFLALTLLSHSHFATLRASWAYERIPISRSLSARWTAFSLVFLLILQLAVLVLPTGYSMGLFAALSSAISWVMGLVVFLFTLLIYPLMYLLYLFRLLMGSDEPLPDLPAPPAPEALTPEVVVSSPSYWLEVVKTLAFWAILLGVIGYAVYLYARQNEQVLQALRRIPGVALLGRFWRWLRGRLQALGVGASQAVRAGLQRLRSARPAVDSSPWRFINLRRLSPRQRVLFFYLALVRRAGEVGLPRQPSQTPYEYAHTLAASEPEVDTDVASLTESFVEARYSRHDITPDKAGLVQRIWERLRRALRRKPRATDN